MGLKRFLSKRLEAKEAERLADFLIDVCRSDKALKIMSDQCNFTPMEANRFIIGAGIYNLSNASIYLLIRSEDEEQAEKLIESLTEVFVKRFRKANDKVCVGDIIVYGPELDFIFEKCGLYRNSMIDYEKLVSLLIFCRYRRYSELRVKALNEASISKTSMKMFSLIDEFARHFSGRNNADDLGALRIPVIALLEIFHKEIINYCNRYVL